VELRDRTGVNVAKCYQCGKCSAGCPMAGEMAIRTHEIMHLVQRDHRDRLLESDSIWLCLACETCSARCPTGADPARVIDALRELALERDPSRAPRTIGAFNRSFLDQIQQTGRMSEVGLAAQYNVRSGRFLQDAAAMPSLLLRGKLNVIPSGIRDPGEVRRIFRNVEKQRNGKGAR
jgi:heterodisulfide reductase subunit C